MKRGVVGFVLICLVFILPFASAGIFDFLKRDKVRLAPQDVSVTVGNSVPVVTILSVDTDDIVDLTPASSTSVNIEFTVTDSNGVSDLNEPTLSISYTSVGETTRSTTGVGACSSGDAGNTRTYNCLVDMQFYDGAAVWNAEVSIDDVGGPATGQDLTHAFTVSQLKDISLSAAVSFGTVSAGQTDIVSTTDTTVTNNGNYEVPGDGELTITSGPLYEPAGIENIPATNFRTVATAEFAQVCSGPGGVDHDGTALNIPLDILPKGVSATESYRHCLTDVGSVSSAIYSTTNPNGVAWEFTI